MNILVPYKWLLEHVDTSATPEELQHDLSLSGPSVERINQSENEAVFDIEVTTNRVDAASIRGIAQETAAILPEFKKKAVLKPYKTYTPDHKKLPKLDIQISNNPKLCHRILAVKLANVSLEPSPLWLQKRLIQVGQRPLNNLIDITNYCMWEMGHPIHAFDYDKILSKKIIVREAKKGESIVTLDKKTHTCLGGEVVFDDGTGRIIDLPGIMGTENTVISASTKNVLLWIESVDAAKIRKASMSLAIRSQAAILNEKKVDPELGLVALKRAIHFYQTICHATVASEIVDIYPNPKIIQSTFVAKNTIDTYLGISLNQASVTRILENLGCKVQYSPQGYNVTPPSSRASDLIIPQDYIEEIARIYGYHHLPSTIMSTPIPIHVANENFDIESTIKTALMGWGLNEVYTYSMVSKTQALQSGSALSEHIKIKNPLSDDWVYMRRSLLPSLQAVQSQNQSKEKTIFELQNVYLAHQTKLPTEQLQLCVLSYRDTTQALRQIRGILDNLMSVLYIKSYEVIATKNPPKPYEIDKTANIMSGNIILGYMGVVKTDGCARVGFHLNMEEIIKLSSTHPMKLNQSQYPPIIEDLTFTLKVKTFLGPIIDSVLSVNSTIEKVTLKEIYNQNYTLTINYRSATSSLKTEEIAPIRLAIVKMMHTKYAAELVGSLKD